MKQDFTVTGFLIHDSKVLLIHHKKLNMWLPPGGHIDPDEAPDDALVREFKEEVNVDIEILNRNDVPESGNILRQFAVPFHVSTHSVGDHNHCNFAYLCKAKVTDVKMQEGEVIDYAWFTIEDLDKNHITQDVKNISLKAFELLDKLKESS